MTSDFDYADLLDGIFGQPKKPKNPFMASLPTNTRLWLEKLMANRCQAVDHLTQNKCTLQKEHKGYHKLFVGHLNEATF